MKKRRLGKSGMVVSEIGMGTMTFGSSCDEPTSFKILDKAYDSGIDFMILLKFILFHQKINGCIAQKKLLESG